MSVCAALYQQCGGISFTGPICCQSGAICVISNEWYSQCQPSAPSNTVVPTVPVISVTTKENPPTSVPTSKPSSIEQFQKCIKGESASLVLPSNPNYNALSSGNHNRIHRYPAGVYLANSEEDIVNAIKCAYNNRLRPVPRSGGHSYESFSSQTGSIVIDIANVNTVKLISTNEASGTAIAAVGAGARLGNVYSSIWDLGKYTFNAGTCPTVGIGGHISGGGYGMLARLKGLAADQTIGMRVVLYNGTLINVDSQSNPDLFWALRGGGSGSFGIITEYRINVYRIPEIHMFTIRHRAGSRGEVLRKWMKYFSNPTPKLTTQLNIDKWSSNLVGQFSGPLKELNELIESSGILKVADMEHHYRKEYANALEAKSYVNSWGSNVNDLKVKVHDLQERKDYGKYKSDYGNEPIPENMIKDMIFGPKGIDANPGGAWIQFEGLGGALAQVAPDATPYVHRKSLFSMQYAISLPDGADNNHPSLKWIRNFEALIKPITNGEHYQNYPDLDLGDKFGVGYFGEANFKRLKSIKAVYDPLNIFRNEQSIPLP
ncbi:hypothetical protein HDV02_002973 [Globomyces sp. JEL0801]|nr:hypothetical protein HDV02_002973 [Globomyces sp. JEL0801]